MTQASHFTSSLQIFTHHGWNRFTVTVLGSCLPFSKTLSIFKMPVKSIVFVRCLYIATTSKAVTIQAPQWPDKSLRSGGGASHTGPRQGKEPGSTVAYFAGPASSCTSPSPVQCEWRSHYIYLYRKKNVNHSTDISILKFCFSKHSSVKMIFWICVASRDHFTPNVKDDKVTFNATAIIVTNSKDRGR